MRGAPWLEHERRELEAWLDERAAARLSGGNRASAEVQRHSGGIGTLGSVLLLREMRALRQSHSRCRRQSGPSKVMPFGGVSGLPRSKTGRPRDT